MQILKQHLQNWWSKGTTIRYQKELYQVHKMSYGDYFLEPKSWNGGETDGFAPKTQWFYLKDAQAGIYGLESNKANQSY